MTYIRRIEIKGFKTFNRKVSLSLDKGLTVITGPNGSGKSSVADAVKFVLGELSPKEMRSSTMSAIISKSETDACAKSAYVAVELDNSERRIPIDADVLTLSRELSDDGEGIYRINGQRVSRKQLVEILSGAGISTDGFNIIPQNSITKLAEMSAEDRRKVIEEMVGIAAYDARKAEAQAQLHQAEINIKIASARIGEVRLRVEALERERNDYLRYLQLKRAMAELSAKLLSNKIVATEAELASVKARLEELGRRLSELKAQRDLIYGEKGRLEAQIQELEDSSLSKKEGELFKLEREISELNSRLAYVSSKARLNEESLNDLCKELRELDSAVESVREEIKVKEDRIAELEAQKASVEKLISEKSKEIQAIVAELDELKGSFAEVLERKESLNKELDLAKAELDGLEAEAAWCLAYIGLLEKLAKGIETKLGVLGKCHQILESLLPHWGALASRSKRLVKAMDFASECYAIASASRGEPCYWAQLLGMTRLVRSLLLSSIGGVGPEKATFKLILPLDVLIAQLEACVDSLRAEGAMWTALLAYSQGMQHSYGLMEEWLQSCKATELLEAIASYDIEWLEGARELALRQLAHLELSYAKKARIASTLQEIGAKLAKGPIDLKARASGLLGRHEALLQELSGLMSLKKSVQAELADCLEALKTKRMGLEVALGQKLKIEAKIDGLSKVCAELSSELKGINEEVELKEKARRELITALKDAKESRRNYEARALQLDESLRAIAAELDSLNESYASLLASASEKEAQLSYYMHQLKELGFSAPLRLGGDEDLSNAEELLQTIKGEMEALAGLNQLACSQYDEVKDNYKQLASRIYELEAERLSIIKFMEEVERDKKDAFMKAYDAINAEFSRSFLKLTGGKGRLILDSPDNPFEGGMDVEVQFPGKPPLSIRAASGGERSLATVCFLLALHTFKRMPFYIMDEIDAHLDAVNAQRLAELLKEMSKDSQLIMISLKDVMIARADKVYGVYMRDGSSQVVSLTLR